MKNIYFLLPALAGIMFGSSGIFVRNLTENGIDPTTLLFLRFSIAAVVMFVCVLLTDKSLFKIKKEYHRNSLIVMSFVILFYFNFYATCDPVALLRSSPQALAYSWSFSFAE